MTHLVKHSYNLYKELIREAARVPDKRLLMILSDLRSRGDVKSLMLSAIENAAKPARLLFAIPDVFMEQEDDELTSLIMTLPKGDARFYAEADGAKAALSTRGGATHVLMLRGKYGFIKDWDIILLKRYEKCGERSALLTGMVSELGETGEAECYLPAISRDFWGDSAVISRGIPIVQSAQPVHTLIVNPAIMLARPAFFERVEQEPTTLSFACFIANIRVYALDRPVMYTIGSVRQRTMRRPPVEALPGGSLERFEKRVGFSFDRQIVGIRAQWGYFGAENGYAQALPADAVLRDAARALKRSVNRRPLIVTAIIDLPKPKHPPLYYQTRFEYLKGIGGLPLILYAGGSYERGLRARYPGTVSYPDRGLLPYSLLFGAMPPKQHFLRSKLLLLRRAMSAYSGYSHVMWLDIDVVSHPVCPQARLMLGHLMDGKAHIAMVDGTPDTSVIIVPGRILKLLCREVEAINQLDVELGRDLSEESLLMRLIAKFPDLITVHNMAHRGLLLLTGLDAAALSADERARLITPAIKADDEEDMQ